MNDKKIVVMIIEDEELILQAIEKKMKHLGIDGIACAGGTQALDLLNEMTDMPDAIWLDYYLKDMDGLMFMAQLKRNEKWSKIPVFVVSNSASSTKVHSMLALGVKKYFLKAEHRLDELIALLVEYIKEDRKGTHNKILVAEDDKFLADAVKLKLLKEKFEVKIASDGEEAIEMLSSFHPDAVLLDLMMPKKDGYTVLTEIRANPHFMRIPVIIASNLGQKEEIDKGMKLGATDFYVKSDVSLSELVAKIKALLPDSTGD